jgi:two-component system cell cycle sensor histidine kinase/response regulator CckA
MPFGAHDTGAGPSATPAGRRFIVPVVLIAAVLAVAYWIIEALAHATFLGTPFVGELFTLEPHVVIARVAFLAVLGVCAAVSVALAGRAQRARERSSRATDRIIRTIMENVREMIVLHDRNLTAVWANKASGDSLGMEPEDIVGKHCYELWHNRSEACVPCPVLLAMETGEPQRNDNVTPDGRAFSIRGYPLRGERGEIVGAIEVTTDVTHRKRTEEALALEKERLAVTLASIADGVIVTDRGGTVTFMNDAAERLTGWRGSEAAGRKLSSILAITGGSSASPCDDLLDTVLRTGVPASLSDGATLSSRDGVDRIIADSGAPIRSPDGTITGMILVFRDMTERRRLEGEIMKSQKLESLGVLAGGIAHDFNNVLTAIIGNASLAQLSLGIEDRTRAVLADIEKAALRARKLTQQLLTFSKGGAPLKKPTALNDVVQDTVRFALSGSNVSSAFEIPPDLWQVDADADQISHAVNNIVINSREAMPEGGLITVRAENVELIGDTTLPLRPQKYVRISIEDHGEGISREHLTRVFDPYFTTKEDSHSGLGLAVAFSVVRKHGGHIVIDSEPGVSTTVTIYLPAAEAPRAEGAQEDAVEMRRGHGRVLVMDDEEMVRSVLTKILERFGYEAAFASEGMEAIEAYREALESGTPFDAVIMDLTVTIGMGGREAIELLRLLDPEAKVIVSSGYSDDPVMSDFGKYGFDGAIAKPFRADELSAALEALLSGKSTTSRRSTR